ncbi:hypothetical protein [Kitasatospora sp. NPDC051914]|uniref:hypothetical protein n=1 Tax=Kitasatospora sp. NPDC051914 TaxID=3154945 RepID=UPI00341FC7D4
MLRTRLVRAAAVTTLALGAAAVTPALVAQATTAQHTRTTATTVWEIAPAGKVTTVWE